MRHSGRGVSRLSGARVLVTGGASGIAVVAWAQRQGRIGTFPPIKGQEAAHLGPVAALRASDWLVPAFRESAAEIWRGRKFNPAVRTWICPPTLPVDTSAPCTRSRE